MSQKLVLSCEHAGNQIPQTYEILFRNAWEILNSHRGLDPGALELARSISEKMNVRLHFTEISRLLVEANRSMENPQLFSEFTVKLPAQEKKFILDTLYRPYRQEVEDEIRSNYIQGIFSIHLSVHTFTPELDGEKRNADIGLLFDPSRQREAEIAFQLSRAILKIDPELQVKENYPYKGTDDGFTTYLRKKYLNKYYAGIELEVNQKFPQNEQEGKWRKIQDTIVSAISSTIRL